MSEHIRALRLGISRRFESRSVFGILVLASVASAIACAASLLVPEGLRSPATLVLHGVIIFICFVEGMRFEASCAARAEMMSAQGHERSAPRLKFPVVIVGSACAAAANNVSAIALERTLLPLVPIAIMALLVLIEVSQMSRSLGRLRDDEGQTLDEVIERHSLSGTDER